MRKKKMQYRDHLVIWRTLPNGILDKFEVYCTENLVDVIRNKYKALGYNVA